MTLGVLHKRIRNSLWSSDTGIWEDGALELMREVVVQDKAIEISTIIKQKIEVRLVGSIVE